MNKLFIYILSFIICTACGNLAKLNAEETRKEPKIVGDEKSIDENEIINDENVITDNESVDINQKNERRLVKFDNKNQELTEEKKKELKEFEEKGIDTINKILKSNESKSNLLPLVVNNMTKRQKEKIEKLQKETSAIIEEAIKKENELISEEVSVWLKKTVTNDEEKLKLFKRIFLFQCCFSPLPLCTTYPIPVNS